MMQGMNRPGIGLRMLLPWLALSCAACSAFLPTRETPPEGQLPAAFAMREEDAAEVDRPDRWWEAFGSEELNRLLDEALEENLTLRQAWARLDQAGSSAVQAAAGLYPEVSLDGGASYNRAVRTVEGAGAASWQSQMKDAVINGTVRGISNAFSGGGGVAGQIGGSGLSAVGGQATGGQGSTARVTTETKQFDLSLAVSYEVDLWRRVSSQARAAQRDFEATREDVESAAMTLAAEIVQRWLAILEQQALKAILAEQVETNATYLELVELRFRKSQVSALDVYQQRQAVSEVKKLIPLTEAQEQILRHELAVLLGKPPGSILTLGTYDLEAVPPLPSAGVPADLLMNRPDMRSALARLNAADYRVAVSRADRLPAIRLSGGVGYGADDIANLFDDWFVNLAASLTAPLFDGSRRKAEVDRTLAVVEERLASYRLTVLTAIREVEDALVLERKQGEHVDALARELEDARNALEQAGERYLKGQNDYLPVLTALERTQFLTRNLVAARRDLLSFRVGLYRALGGSWTRELEPPARLSEEEGLAEADESL